jgi:hypothetical protein
MAPSPELSAAVRARGDELEVDGVNFAHVSGEDVLWDVFFWEWLAPLRLFIRVAAQKLRRKPIVRFGRGRVTIVRGRRETTLPAVGVGVQYTDGPCALYAQKPDGGRVRLPSPKLLDLELAELAELLDARVRA